MCIALRAHVQFVNARCRHMQATAVPLIHSANDCWRSFGDDDRDRNIRRTVSTVTVVVVVVIIIMMIAGLGYVKSLYNPKWLYRITVISRTACNQRTLSDGFQ